MVVWDNGSTIVPGGELSQLPARDSVRHAKKEWNSEENDYCSVRRHAHGSHARSGLGREQHWYLHRAESERRRRRGPDLAAGPGGYITTSCCRPCPTSTSARRSKAFGLRALAVRSSPGLAAERHPARRRPRTSTVRPSTSTAPATSRPRSVTTSCWRPSSSGPSTRRPPVAPCSWSRTSRPRASPMPSPSPTVPMTHSISQAFPSSGDFGMPVFGINMAVVPTEDTSWGSVKSMFQ